MIYERAVRPLLFRLGDGDPEAAHERTTRWLAALTHRPRTLSALRSLFAVDAPRTLFGVRFPSPIGLAAGMDKDGHALRAWPALGFGFVEVGTVTRHAQPGNERPRLFRLRDSEAIINRMGFNNAGAEALARRLAALGPLSVPLGVSLGKSKVTPLADAAADYAASYGLLRPYGDYFAVNVSSPNTPGLRTLQDKSALGDILAALRGDKPILVKIAPDLTDHAVADLLDVCAEHDVAGLIATNTTLGRDGLATTDAAVAAEPGGLSGRPLTERARQVVRFVSAETGGRLPIIGVGGIGSADDALRLLDAGADAIQLYTGFIYHGPGLVKSINHALRS